MEALFCWIANRLAVRIIRRRLAQTPPVFKGEERFSECSRGLAGCRWQSMGVGFDPGAVGGGAKFASTNGAAPHGSIVAFKMEEEGGKTIVDSGVGFA